MKLDPDDLLMKLLDEGRADAEAQRDAAEFIRWMAQFVPNDAGERRKRGEK